jgi:putative methionine-R-sulfoxide reductase with GAF domain
VIPLIVNDRVVGVLDVDSQLLASFSSPLVRAFMEKLAALIVEVSDWTPILRELK